MSYSNHNMSNGSQSNGSDLRKRNHDNSYSGSKSREGELGKRSNPYYDRGDEREANSHSSRKRELKDNGKSHSSNDAPATNEFSSFPEIPSKSVENFIARGIKNLFPIQAHSFYPIYNRQDVIGRDLTGSGKTLGFSLPITEYLRAKGLLSKRRIQAVMLAPTRELALQVNAELNKLKHSQNEYTTLCVYGGVSIDDQTQSLRRGVEIVVGTTGRVLDHIRRGNLDFSDLKTVVLDEADQMLKMGFKEDVEEILTNVRKQCSGDLQICLFSATVPSWVKEVAQQHMKRDLKMVDLAKDLQNKTSRTVSHLAINCPFHNRMSTLADILLCYGGIGKVIVFTQTKADANSLLLTDKIKLDIEVMHGDIAQNQREVTMKRFKDGKFRVLVATDVASRGLDVPNVDLVIQLEPPREVETYIHRSGRTARAGNSGTCITFYQHKNKHLIEEIERVAGINLQRIGIPQAEDVVKAQAKGVLTKLNEVNSDVLSLFEETANLLLQKHNGDHFKALCTSIAYISGQYKSAAAARSLLTGQEQQLTMKLYSTQNSNLPPNVCQQILRRYWPSQLTESIRSLRGMRSGQGVVFDINSDQHDRFIDTYEHLKQNEGDRLDFAVARCTDLPDLAEDSHNDDNGHRNGGGGGYDRGYGGGGYGGDRGNRGSRHEGNGRGRGRGNGGGGFDGGRGSERRSGGGGWERDGGNNWGNNQNNWNLDVGFNKSKSGSGRQSHGASSEYASSRASAYSTPMSCSGQSTPQQSHRTVKQVEPTAIFVSNLSNEFDERDVIQMFSEQDLQVRKARLLYDNFGRSKCAGFVEFASPHDAQDAVMSFNGMQVNHQRLIVQTARA